MNILYSWRLKRAARSFFGWSSLRRDQLTAMKALMRGRDAVVVLPTGAGKSAVYQVPAALLPGPTIVISPLLALQHDQIEALNARDRADVRAVRVNSSQTPAQQRAALDEIRTGAARLLFITPEQLAAPERLAEVAALRPALVAVDEAHCLTTWGQDFRPDYLALGHAIRALGRPPIVALTATASPPVREDIAARLGMRKPVVVVGGLDRPNLFIEAAQCPSDQIRWRRLLAFLDEQAGAGIIYVTTRRAAEDLSARLTDSGRPAACYHGAMPAGTRRRRHEQFSAGELPIVVATSAFGMGIDKADIRWVVHVALPDSPDSYLQEIGRAGRDGLASRVLLLYRAEDMALQRFFAGGAVAVDDLTYVAACVRSGATSKASIVTQTGMTARKVASLLGLLEEVGAVSSGTRGELRTPPYAPEPAAAARLAAVESERHRTLQRSRTDMMRQFAESSGCRVVPLLTYFGEQMRSDCGHCDNCANAGVRAGRTVTSTPARDLFPLHAEVRHRDWGVGTVLGYDDDRMTVLFEAVGYKTLSVTVVRDNDLLAAV